MKTLAIIIAVIALLAGLIKFSEYVFTTKKWEVFAKQEHCKQIGDTAMYQCDHGQFTKK